MSKYIRILKPAQQAEMEAAEDRRRRLVEARRCGGDGKKLRALGFDFFEADREYSIAAPDENGVVEVHSYSSEDGPDEDGFGREIYYDWWLLDENLQPIPGVKPLYDYSHIDMRIPSTEREWESRRARAGEILRKRK